MKKTLALAALLWLTCYGTAYAKFVPETTSATAASADMVDTTKGAVWAMTSSGTLVRLKAGADGSLSATLGGGGVMYYASLTYTAIGAPTPVSGCTVVAAVPGKTITVLAHGISTDTAARITLHHGHGAAVRSNSGVGNIIGGGIFAANNGEAQNGIAKRGLAPNQPVCVDFSTAITSVEVWVIYTLD